MAHAAFEVAPSVRVQQCYDFRGKASFDGVPDQTLVDAFGTFLGDVKKPRRLCAPADLNETDLGAPGDPDHFSAYCLTVAEPPPVASEQVVVNQFGTSILDVMEPAVLLVPTRKSLAAPAPPAPPSVGDVYTCHRVSPSLTEGGLAAVPPLDATTQFEAVALEAKKIPRWLYAPTDKDGAAPSAEQRSGYLLCYETKAKVRAAGVPVFLADEFGEHDRMLVDRAELCVPSFLNPGPTTTTSTTTTTSSTSSTTTTSPPMLCSNGVIDAGEQCDDGVNNTDLPNCANQGPICCRTDCTPRRCGDGIVDFEFLEVCESDADCGGGRCDSCLHCFF